MSNWFRNMQVYRLGAVRGDPVKWSQILEVQRFTPPSSNESLRTGWTAPREDGALAYAVNRQMLLALTTEKRVMPAGAVNLKLAERVAELTQSQGFAPGKKATKELRERVIDELLPRALTTRARTGIWVDPVNGWLVVDTPAPGRADEVLKFLLKAFDKFPVESWRVQRSPIACMTEWLQSDEAPAGFTIDMDATLRAIGESRAQVQYKRHTLDADDLRRHIAAGKQCEQLAMTWGSKISFVLTANLAIKAVKSLDILGDGERSKTEDQDERFASDFMLMTGELAKMLRDLQTALGGEAKC